jgi:hypothetical protein
MRTFTIQKLMFAIAILAVILGGFISLTRMEPAGSRCGPTCGGKLKTIVLGLHGYQVDQKGFPIATWPNPNLPPEKRLSWYAAMQPYLDNPELWEMLDKSQHWDAESNHLAESTRVRALDCPESPHVPLPASNPTQYIGIAGEGTDAPFLPKGHRRAGIFGYERQTSLADINDGAAVTMFVAESGRARGAWLAGGPATVRGLDTAELPYVGPGRQFGGLHPNGMYVSGLSMARSDS